MNLYLIRHADAVPFSEFRGTDEERPLTDRGHHEARRLGEVLKIRQIFIDRIITSTLVRAIQTAQEIIPILGLTPEQVGVNKELSPGGKVRKLAKHLNELKEKSIALVGHMPDISVFAAWMIGSKKANLQFEKSGIAFIQIDDEVEKGGGSLNWLLTPEWMN
jgi:phosphohistidine phosphatase